MFNFDIYQNLQGDDFLKIIFDKNSRYGFVLDFTTSMSMVYNSGFENKIKEYGIEPNKEIEKIVKNLKKRIDFTGYEKVLDVLINEDVNIIYSCLKSTKLVQIDGIDAFIENLKTLSEEDIMLNTILAANDFCNKTDLTKEDASNIIKSRANLIGFIDKCELDESHKWKLFSFLNNIQDYMNKFISFSSIYYKQYINILNSNQKTLDKLCKNIEKNINERGIDYITELVGNFMGPDTFENSAEIYISPLFFNNVSLTGDVTTSTAYIAIGFDCEKLIKLLSGESSIGTNLNLFKNMCDKTRFNILKLLVKEQLYNQEIAEKIGITMATTTYHMDFLLGSNLVHVERVGHKTYYALNKAAIIKGIEFLKETFELDN